LPIDEQISVLKKTNDKNIIIVSTNIAEESITIDYLDVVIDL
jgi:HrpA-like RNA helicase